MSETVNPRTRSRIRPMQRSQHREDLHSKVCEGLREQARDVDHHADMVHLVDRGMISPLDLTSKSETHKTPIVFSDSGMKGISAQTNCVCQRKILGKMKCQTPQVQLRSDRMVECNLNKPHPWNNFFSGTTIVKPNCES